MDKLLQPIDADNLDFANKDSRKQAQEFNSKFETLRAREQDIQTVLNRLKKAKETMDISELGADKLNLETARLQRDTAKIDALDKYGDFIKARIEDFNATKDDLATKAAAEKESIIEGLRVLGFGEKAREHIMTDWPPQDGQFMKSENKKANILRRWGQLKGLLQEGENAANELRESARRTLDELCEG